MPIHDWTRIDAGIFHSFHLSWIAELKTALNCGLLPRQYYGLAGKVVGELDPDVVTFEARGIAGGDSTAEIEEYALKRRTITIRREPQHNIIALIEMLSPGNKSSRHALHSFLDKATAALTRGVHLLLIDLHPPGLCDPQGVHSALWNDFTGEPFKQPADKPLTLAAYAAAGGPEVTAYVEPVAVGDALPDMPLFLDPEQYINVPLEATYREAYASVPRFYRNILEAGSAS